MMLIGRGIEAFSAGAIGGTKSSSAGFCSNRMLSDSGKNRKTYQHIDNSLWFSDCS